MTDAPHPTQARQTHVHTKQNERLRRYGIARGLYHLLLGIATLLGGAVTATSAAASQLVLAYGDSLMAGYQLGPTEGFAPQLEAALRKQGRDVTVRSAAVSGDTSAAGRARLNWVLAGLKAKPDLVLLELGANDMLRGQPPATLRANLDTMLSEFAKRAIPVVLAGMQASPNLGAAYVRDFNRIYPELAQAHRIPLYPFFLSGVAATPNLQLTDGMHPNPRGVAVIVRGILPTVDAALGPVQPVRDRRQMVPVASSQPTRIR